MLYHATPYLLARLLMYSQKISFVTHFVSMKTNMKVARDLILLSL